GGAGATPPTASSGGPGRAPIVPSRASAANRAELPIAAIAYVAGLTALFLGERVLPTIAWLKWGFTAPGLAPVLPSIVLPVTPMASAGSERRTVERGLMALSVVGLLAVIVQLATTEDGERLLHLADAAIGTRSKFESIATSLWVALLACATTPLLFA